MDNYRITQNSTDVVNKQFVENQLSNYVKADGTSTMVRSLDMDDNQITGLSLHPVTGSEASNKKYLDDEIKKTNIKLSRHTVKNVFQYLMNDVNEWSTEYGCNV